MKLIIDTAARTLTTVEGASERTQPLYSKDAWEAISLQWVRLGWSLGSYYNFSWFGRPILQLPEDLVRLQEVIYSLRPDVIVETGVYRGGSLVFHASLCQALGKGRVSVSISASRPPTGRPSSVTRSPRASLSSKAIPSPQKWSSEWPRFFGRVKSCW